MDDEFYKTALKWYNTMYVSPASDRIVYFILLVVSCICLCFAISTTQFIMDVKNKKRSYVMLLDSRKDPDESVRIAKMQQNGNSQMLGLYKLLLEKYVVNFESLQYKNAENAMTAVRKKAVIIKNLSSENLYQDYINGSQQNDESDISLALLNIKKTVTIHKIEFFYGSLNLLDKIYSYLSQTSPRQAKVYFSTETTNERNKKFYFVANVSFNFHIKQSKDGNSSVEFKVNDYYKEKIDKISFLQNDSEDYDNVKNDEHKRKK